MKTRPALRSATRTRRTLTHARRSERDQQRIFGLNDDVLLK